MDERITLDQLKNEKSSKPTITPGSLHVDDSSGEGFEIVSEGDILPYKKEITPQEEMENTIMSKLNNAVKRSQSEAILVREYNKKILNAENDTSDEIDEFLDNKDKISKENVDDMIARPSLIFEDQSVIDDIIKNAETEKEEEQSAQLEVVLDEDEPIKQVEEDKAPIQMKDYNIEKYKGRPLIGTYDDDIVYPSFDDLEVDFEKLDDDLVKDNNITTEKVVNTKVDNTSNEVTEDIDENIITHEIELIDENKGDVNMEQNNSTKNSDIEIIGEEVVNESNNVDDLETIEIDTSNITLKNNAYSFDNDDIDEEEQEEATKEAINNLKKSIKENVKCINNVIDLKSFTVSKKPITVSNTIPEKDPLSNVSTWIAYGQHKVFNTKEYTADDISNLMFNKNNNLYTEYTRIYGTIYNHIVDSNKPKSFEAWAKTTLFEDIDHYYAGAYMASFDKANYIPYICSNKRCSNSYISQNVPIRNMVKFKNDEIKNQVYDLIKTGDTQGNKYKAYRKQISDRYVIDLFKPSIWSTLIEPSLMTSKFREKYMDFMDILPYIDQIYYIDYNSHSLRPIEFKIDKDQSKTIMSRAQQYIKVIRTLTSDQRGLLISEFEKLTSNSDDIKYIIPESTCPKCGNKIKEEILSASDILFIRHQLTVLASSSTK